MYFNENQLKMFYYLKIINKKYDVNVGNYSQMLELMTKKNIIKITVKLWFFILYFFYILYFILYFIMCCLSFLFIKYLFIYLFIIILQKCKYLY